MAITWPIHTPLEIRPKLRSAKVKWQQVKKGWKKGSTILVCPLLLMEEILSDSLQGFYTSWVVQESFHQQYFEMQFSIYQKKQKLLVAPISSGKRWSCLPLEHVAETNVWVARRN